MIFVNLQVKTRPPFRAISVNLCSDHYSSQKYDIRTTEYYGQVENVTDNFKYQIGYLVDNKYVFQYVACRPNAVGG